MLSGNNEKVGTFISAGNSPKWIKTMDEQNKWLKKENSKSLYEHPVLPQKPQIKLKKIENVDCCRNRLLEKRQKSSNKKLASVIGKPSIKSKENIKSSLGESISDQMQKLDYCKIIDSLKNAEVKDKCDLLLALRWVCC